MIRIYLLNKFQFQQTRKRKDSNLYENIRNFEFLLILVRNVVFNCHSVKVGMKQSRGEKHKEKYQQKKKFSMRIKMLWFQDLFDRMESVK